MRHHKEVVLLVILGFLLCLGGLVVATGWGAHR